MSPVLTVQLTHGDMDAQNILAFLSNKKSQFCHITKCNTYLKSNKQTYVGISAITQNFYSNLLSLAYFLFSNL